MGRSRKQSIWILIQLQTIDNARRGGYDGRKEVTMTRRDEIDMEIRNQAVRHYSECRALFELPLIVYNQIMQDNDLRKRPYKVSFNRIHAIIMSMPEFD